MSHNDITGDKIATGVATDAFREGHDRIFGKNPKVVIVDEVQTIADMVEQEKDKDAIATDLAGN
jgi:hypothetical protein